MNNPFEYWPDEACSEAFRRLLDRLEVLKGSDLEADVNFCRELEDGKMLGVLVAADEQGVHHNLYAFSGQLGDGGFFYPGFVEPVFDYLRPDGYFKQKEADISRMNAQIAQFEKGYSKKEESKKEEESKKKEESKKEDLEKEDSKGIIKESFPKIEEKSLPEIEEKTLPEIRAEYEHAKEAMDVEITEFREKCRLSKMEREERRLSGVVDEVELAEMIRQSQFEKAELHRLKKRLASELEPLATGLKEAQAYLDEMKEKRRAESEALQEWLFSNFRVLNARGESRSLQEIFAETPFRIPPSGAGECCAPKLLQAAYQKGWKPVAMAEYWYGKPKGGEVRIHGEHYPACRGKCLPVLSWMLQGLDITPPLDSAGCEIAAYEPEILFENEWFCIVNKPAGMLSVPGKGAAVSVQQWLARRYGAGKNVKMAHRLDRDTSGLLIATFGELPYKIMQSLFATRKVKKTYIADLEGDYESRGIAKIGRISLPLTPDWLDRPRQRVDREGGKEAVTDYEFQECRDDRSRIIFHPQTGRTHQLRVHSASESGLGMPIVGDRLYGKNRGHISERLHLHAQKLEFIFPTDGASYCFESPAPF